MLVLCPEILSHVKGMVIPITQLGICMVFLCGYETHDCKAIRYVIRWNSTEGNPALFDAAVSKDVFFSPNDDIHSNMDHCHSDLPDHWVSGGYTLECSNVYIFTLDFSRIFQCCMVLSATKPGGDKTLTHWLSPFRFRQLRFRNLQASTFRWLTTQITLGCLRSTEDDRKHDATGNNVTSKKRLHIYQYDKQNIYIFSISK